MADDSVGYIRESHATAEETANRKLHLSTFDIWCLGITTVIGGQYFSWNFGYAAGFGSYLISTLLIGTSYVCLCFCNAEIASALPFAGGAYGLARVSLGMYPGFIIGCLEVAEYIVYVATSAISLSMMIINLTKASQNMLPVCCLLFYLSAVTIHLLGGRIFWWTNIIFAIVSIGLILIYILGSIPFCDFLQNAITPAVTGGTKSEWFIGGFVSFLSVTPLAAWFFVGVESLNLGAAFVDEPKITIGRASIACAVTLLLTSIGVLFVSASLPPATVLDDTMAGYTLSNDLNPLNNGYIRMFNISTNIAIIISIPATYATAFGFIFAYGRVILAMAKSSLFPPFLTRTWGAYKSPYAAIITGSLLGYFVCIIVHFRPSVAIYLFNYCILSGFFAYISQFVGFILFRIRHSSQERLFISPLGIPGAVYGIFVFTLAAVSIMGYQADQSIAFIAFLVSIIIYSVYYFAYAKKRQRFSPEEKFIFILQIVKFNERARLLATRGTLVKRPQAFLGFQSSRIQSSSHGASAKSNKPTITNLNSVDMTSSPIRSCGVSAFVSIKNSPRMIHRTFDPPERKENTPDHKNQNQSVRINVTRVYAGASVPEHEGERGQEFDPKVYREEDSVFHDIESVVEVEEMDHRLDTSLVTSYAAHRYDSVNEGTVSPIPHHVNHNATI